MPEIVMEIPVRTPNLRGVTVGLRLSLFAESNQSLKDWLEEVAKGGSESGSLLAEAVQLAAVRRIMAEEILLSRTKALTSVPGVPQT